MYDGRLELPRSSLFAYERWTQCETVLVALLPYGSNQSSCQRDSLSRMGILKAQLDPVPELTTLTFWVELDKKRQRVVNAADRTRVQESDGKAVPSAEPENGMVNAAYLLW